MSLYFNNADHYGITRFFGPKKNAPSWLVSVSRRSAIGRKVFTDRKYGGEDAALRAAQEYRDQWLAQHPPSKAIELAQAPASHNTSGIPGVARYLNPRNGAPRWEAFVSSGNKKITKSFAISKYGEDGARDKAIAARQAMLIQFQSEATRLFSPAAKALARVQHPDTFGSGEAAQNSSSAPQDLARSSSLQNPASPAHPTLAHDVGSHSTRLKKGTRTVPRIVPLLSPEQWSALGHSQRTAETAVATTALTPVSVWQQNNSSVLSQSKNQQASSQGTTMTRSITAITPLGDQLLFSAMSGREEMSRLFEFQVELLSESHTISPPALLGKSISLEIMTHKGGKRYLDGHCMRFAYLGNHGRFYKYQATLRPTLWYATRGSDMKIFQKKSVPDIIKEVLGKYPIELKMNLVETYREWDYCVQYKESDFNFVSRLMEHEGVHFNFEHSAGSHTLVLRDAVDTHKPFPGYASVPYYPPDATYSDNEKDHFNSWLITQAVDPGKYVTTEYDFKKPKADLKLIESQPKGHANASYEIYDFPGGYTNLGDGEHYAKVRMEALQNQQETVVGGGHMRGAAPGYLISITNQKRSDQNRKYLVTACDYAMRDNQYEADGSGSYDFQAQMTAIPASDPYRPKRLTPKPHTTGPESAVVVGPKGEEIYTDQYGRVKVQFPWDRIGTKDENSTCWIRVSNPWAGSNFGAIHIPRIGQEVLVDFINGDPDRPIITHRLYNEDNMPPWGLPDNKTQSGILTRSSKGGDPGDGMKNGIGSANALRFEDMKGAEQLWLHAEKDQLTEVENDEDKWVGNDRRKTVDRDETNVIHRDRTETVDRNEKINVHGWRTEEVDLDETITIHKNRKERVDNNETISIGDNRKEDVGKNETISIGINRTETVGKNETIKIGKNRKENVGGMQMETVALADIQNIGLAKMLNVGLGYNINVGAAMMTNVVLSDTNMVGVNQTTSVGKNQSVSVGQNQTTTVGKTYVLGVDGNASIVISKNSIAIKVGDSSITLTDSGEITIIGKKIKSAGSERVDTIGPDINEN
jgi:type VI secretion system secreted protein VgrG